MTARLNKTVLIAALLALGALLPVTLVAQENAEAPEIDTIDDLRQAIEAVLEETGTPAAGIALVNRLGPVWVAGVGKANREDDIDADEDTMFRIGSISKMIVGLSILKLQEEGRLSLDDKVRDLVPEIEFENPWEDTAPVRVVHLLEHTTGWDDLHLVEYAHNDPTPITLKQGLDLHPHSRISRWQPGTRMSYCNSGPPVAAYIVEKITGQKFEDYAEEKFFRPMGMDNMTHLFTEGYQQHAAALYENGERAGYDHISVRPSGSMNASPRDMARLLMFYLNGASVNGIQLISRESLERMQTAMSNPAAAAGMEAGYGLNNYTSMHNGFVYRGHNGGITGGLSELAYLPEYGVGHAIMINEGNGETITRIIELVRDFETRNLEPPALPEVIPEPDTGLELDGWYYPINPRAQFGYFLQRLLGMQHVTAVDGKVQIQALMGGEPRTYVSAGGALFRAEDEAITSMALVSDPLAGTVLHARGSVLKPVSAVVAFGQLGIAGLWVVFMASALLFALVWGVRRWRGSLAGGPAVAVRLWPLLATVFVLIAAVLINVGMADPFALLGAPTAVSVGIMLATIAFGVTALVSGYSVIAQRNAPINAVAYWHSAILAALHLLVLVYLFYFGVIGLRTWA